VTEGDGCRGRFCLLLLDGFYMYSMPILLFKVWSHREEGFFEIDSGKIASICLIWRIMRSHVRENIESQFGRKEG